MREPIPSLGFSYPTNTHVSAGVFGRNYQHCVENLDEFSSGNGHWGTRVSTSMGDEAGTRGCWDDFGDQCLEKLAGVYVFGRGY